MTLYEEYRKEVALQASGVAGGTRSTYIEWLNEREVVLLGELLRIAYGEPADEGVGDEPEDEDGADPE